MQINEEVIVRHEGILMSGTVKEICIDDLKIELINGKIIWRKFWQVNKKQK